ncbi:MAG TPA: M17 family peptidase N-terminal domain-containing protein, partial [Terriglobales bacterium]|nr:M17 family peptidase N-terminal domain-containing protein [Terriglobales bacterium]
MKTNLLFSTPAEVETDCLAVVVVDRGDGDKPSPVVDTDDAAVRDAAAELLASGEVTGKMLETAFLHRPEKLKAKRLLLLGGGKGKKFSPSELRRVAGAAIRALKPKGVRTLAFVAPASLESDAAVKAIIEGAFVG